MDPKRMILATCLSAAIACGGLAGCATADRTAGTRIDDHMTEHRVRSALADAPVYKFPNVHTEVYNGIVQLSGFAETREQKKYAGDIASGVPGVRQLINDISVQPRALVSPTGYSYSRQYPAAPTPGNPHPDNYYNGQSDVNNTNGLGSANRQIQSVPPPPNP